jgi:hypothetical protein
VEEGEARRTKAIRDRATWKYMEKEVALGLN